MPITSRPCRNKDPNIKKFNNAFVILRLDQKDWQKDKFVTRKHNRLD